jgi:pyruvate/2-oxoglutarate dehydrogenase complex dihydrolipoamide acyltransferase (E2) component
LQLRLEMPFVAKQVRSCSLAAWHVREGDHFGFGTDLCDVLITEVEGQKGTIGPQHPVPARYRVRIRSSEAGVLASILIAEGGDVSVGDLLAMVSTDPAEPTDRLPPVGAPALRVVADPIRPGGED